MMESGVGRNGTCTIQAFGENGLMERHRDGPALRALATIPYAHYLLDRAFPADIQYVRERLYDPVFVTEPGKVIKNDLEEVAAGWWKAGFDIWEEV